MRASESPPTVDERRDEVATRFADAPGVLCCLDFDGTLAPIVDDPGEAAMADDCAAAVARLAATPTVEVAIVSGRALHDLRERVGLDDVTYAGNHGLELRRTEETEVHPDADGQRDAIDRVCTEVESRTDGVPGVAVEHKGVTATVHYRQVDDERVPEVIDAVEAAVEAVEADGDAEFEVLDGKEIREVRPDVDWDKGRVVASLAADVPEEWETVYVGDDTTDEDAFAVVEPDGLGVLVGDGETAASLRVPSQSHVGDLLELIESSQQDGAFDDEPTDSEPVDGEPRDDERRRADGD